MTDRSIHDLIEASSLGTAEAKTLRQRTSDEDARRIVERSKEISREALDGQVGFLVTGDWCDRCGDTNYDEATRVCLTCTPVQPGAPRPADGDAVSTDVDDISAFIRTQLDARQRLILNRWDSDGKARIATMWTGGNPGYTTVATDHAAGGWIANGREVTDARHVTVLWDPTVELADIDAKRQALDLHSPFVDHRGRVRCSHCSELCHSRSGLDCDDPDARYPCPTMRLLALPFAGRDGYRAEWKP